MATPVVHEHVGSLGAAYDRTQYDDGIRDGDVLRIWWPSGDVSVAILVKAWPVMAFGLNTEGILTVPVLHTLEEGVTWNDFEGGKYLRSYCEAQSAYMEPGTKPDAPSLKFYEAHYRTPDGLETFDAMYTSSPEMAERACRERYKDCEFLRVALDTPGF